MMAAARILRLKVQPGIRKTVGGVSVVANRHLLSFQSKTLAGFPDVVLDRARARRISEARTRGGARFDRDGYARIGAAHRGAFGCGTGLLGLERRIRGSDHDTGRGLPRAAK